MNCFAKNKNSLNFFQEKKFINKFLAKEKIQDFFSKEKFIIKLLSKKRKSLINFSP